MNSRERVLKALEHEEPDRVPLGITQGGFVPKIWSNLHKYFIKPDTNFETALERIQFKDIEIIVKTLGLDFFTGELGDLIWGFDLVFPSRTQKKELPQDSIDTIKEWGTTLEHEHFIGVPQAFPLQRMSLDEYIARYEEESEKEDEQLYDREEKNVKGWKDEYVIMAACGNPGFEHCWTIRGYYEWIRDIYTNPNYVGKLCDFMTKHALKRIKRLKEIGVDIIHIGDDVGSQHGMIIPPDIWRSNFKRHFIAIIGAIKKAGLYSHLHSCGNFEPIIPDLVEMGLDILNPVQPDAMDPAKIKRLYGDKITLHGTISCQATLPFGSVEDVRNEARERIKTCGEGGGLILSPGHIVESDVPLNNLLALFEAGKKYGTYPIRK
jgi:hypothetical protein